MDKLRVCMITPYRPERDGVGDCSVNLVPEMLAKRSDLDVVIVSRDIGERKHEKGIYRILYKKSVTRDFSKQLVEELKSLPRTFVDVLKTIRIINEEKIDVVHVQHEPGVFNIFYSPMILMAAKLMGKKTVLTLHGRDYSLLKGFHNALLYPIPDLITVHTGVHKNLIKRDNVVVIPMGINKLPKIKIKIYPNVLFFGFMSPHKGLEYLVEAFRKVVEKFPNSNLIINGPVNPAHLAEVEYQKKIKQVVSDLGLNKNVILVSKYTEREELPSIKSNIVVFPYTRSYSAGQSAALLDSVSAGKAVIVTKIPGIYERILDGKNGFVVEPENSEELAEAIIKLLSKRKLLEKMCKENLKLAKRESWASVAEIVLDAYDGLIE